MLTQRSWGRFVVVCLLGVFLLPAGSGRGQPDGEPPVVVNFSNQSGSPVELFQSSPQGETSLGVTKDGGKAALKMPAGRTLVVRGEDKKELVRYSTAVAGEVTIRVGPVRGPAAAVSALSAAEVAELVGVHDKVRKEVGVGPVTWSPELGAFAQAWADELARTGTFRHRTYEPGPWQQKYGENIAYIQGNGAGAVVVKGAEFWYAEKKDYTPGTPIPADFSAFKAGHYTQMVWRDSVEIGAGKATIRTGDLKGAQILVCNYKPPGNTIGKTPY